MRIDINPYQPRHQLDETLIHELSHDFIENGKVSVNKRIHHIDLDSTPTKSWVEISKEKQTLGIENAIYNSIDARGGGSPFAFHRTNAAKYSGSYMRLRNAGYQKSQYLEEVLADGNFTNPAVAKYIGLPMDKARQFINLRSKLKAHIANRANFSYDIPPALAGFGDVHSPLIASIMEILTGKGAASGLIPNFNDSFNSRQSKIKAAFYASQGGDNSLLQAIAREHSAGVPLNQINVEKSGELVSHGNPLGLGVTNTRDEPAGIGQGIARAKRQGINPKVYGAAGGFVPNFEGRQLTPSEVAKFNQHSESQQNVIDQLSGKTEEAIAKAVKQIKLSDDELKQPFQVIKQQIANKLGLLADIHPEDIDAHSGSLNRAASNILRPYGRQINQNARKAIDEPRQDAIATALSHKFGTLQNQLQNVDRGFFGFFKAAGGAKKLERGLGVLQTNPLFTQLNDKRKAQFLEDSRNQINSFSDRRGQRVQNAGLLASFALPVLSNALTSQNPDSVGAGGLMVLLKVCQQG